MYMKGTVEQNFLVWHAEFFPPMLIQLPSLNIFSFIPQSGTLDLASALQQVLRGYAKLSSFFSFHLYLPENKQKHAVCTTLSYVEHISAQLSRSLTSSINSCRIKSFPSAL